MRIKKWLSGSMLLLASLAVPELASALVYDGSALPSASTPKWTYYPSFWFETDDYSVDNGILTLNQPGPSGGYGSWYYLDQVGMVGAGDGIEGTGDFYLETRFKLDSNATQGPSFYDVLINMLNNKTSTFYSDDALYVADAGEGVLNINFRRQGTTVASALGTNDGAFHTYRLEYDEDSTASSSHLASRILVDGTEVVPFGPSPIVNFGSSFGDRVVFGDNGGNDQLTGWHWDYVDFGRLTVAIERWAADASGDWNDSANWSGAIPNAVDATANFLGAITAARTVFTDVGVTVGTLKFDNANSYQITGQGSLTIQVSSGSGSISVAQGSHKINLPLAFASDSSISVADGATLTIADPMTIQAGKTVTKSGTMLIQAPLTIEAGGALVLASGPTTAFGAPSLASGARIDMKNNSLMVDYRGQASPASTIKDQIAANAIMSSSATATTGVGWKDDSATQSILVKYTYLGDTNLDGQVDVIDLGNLATAWQTSGVWVNGDSNYDDFVDVIDLGLLATNWQAGVGNPLGPGSLDQALAAYGLPSVSVPEPVAAFAAMLTVAAVSSGRTCRRRKDRWSPAAWRVGSVAKCVK